jgi:hypothetical protein
VELDRGGDARDQGAPAHRHHDDLHVREVLQDLGADRAVAGDQTGIRPRVDEERPLPRPERLDPLEPGGGIEVEDDLGAVAPHRVDLGGGGRLEHRHPAAHAGLARGVGHALGEIARGHHDDAAALLLRAQLGDPVHPAARLVGSRLLEVLALDVEPHAAPGAEACRRQEGRPVHLPLNDRPRAVELLPRDHWSPVHASERVAPAATA